MVVARLYRRLSSAVKRHALLLIGVSLLIVVLVAVMPPFARVTLFGDWGFRNLLRPHERARVLNFGGLHMGAEYPFGSGIGVSCFFDTMVSTSRGPYLVVYERDALGTYTKRAIIERQSMGVRVYEKDALGAFTERATPPFDTTRSFQVFLFERGIRLRLAREDFLTEGLEKALLDGEFLVKLESGLHLHVHDMDHRFVRTRGLIVEPDATGLYSVFSFDLPDLEINLQFTYEEVEATGGSDEDLDYERHIVKMMARPMGYGP